MSIFVVNEPVLRKANGEPHLFIDSTCYECEHDQRFHVNRSTEEKSPVECRYRVGDTREEVCGCDTFLNGEGEEYTLAQWLVFFMDALPLGALRGVDARRARAVQDVCEAAQTPEVGGPGVMEFNDDHYKWLMDILFDDTEGQRIRANGVNPAAKQPEGAWAMNMWPRIAVSAEQALQKRVKGIDDLTPVTEADAADDKIRNLPVHKSSGKKASKAQRSAQARR